ncbi:MAG: fibronectin type III domain-containing protein, partial [Vicinamibacterales bacterium]
SFVGGSIYRIAADTSNPPAAPLGFATQVNGSTVNLGWQPNPGGGGVLNYQLEAGSAPGLSDLLVTSVNGLGLSVGGVPPGRYYVRVRGYNAAGFGPPSGDLSVRVGCGGAPLLPANPTASVAGGIVTLGWQGTAEATGYIVDVGSGPGLTNLAQFVTGGPSLVGPAPSGTYYVRVRAITACGNTPPSDEIVVVVP